jgi:hypothetical protein
VLVFLLLLSVLAILTVAGAVENYSRQIPLNNQTTNAKTNNNQTANKPKSPTNTPTRNKQTTNEQLITNVPKIILF